jgi:glyoxylase-like metal-dependent hydrolase (beta-lactamase superfamily II)
MGYAATLSCESVESNLVGFRTQASQKRFHLTACYRNAEPREQTNIETSMTAVKRIEIRTPFALKRVNCYYIKDSVPTLIDAGVNTEESFEAVRSAVEEAGGTIEGLRRLILTHAHSDHIGLVSRIARLSGADVYIHRWDAGRMLRHDQEGSANLGERYRGFFLEAGVPEGMVEETVRSISERFRRFYCAFSGEKVLEGEETFPFDDFSLEVIHTPGHTPGSICIFNRVDRTLFSGDTLLEKITSNPMAEISSPAGKSKYKSLERYLASLEVIEALPVKRVLPGHGPPFSNHRKRVKELYAHHRARMEEILKILKENNANSEAGSGATEFMLAKRLFHCLEGVELFLGLSEAQGHLQVLQDQGLVFSRKEGAQRLYYLSVVS